MFKFLFYSDDFPNDSPKTYISTKLMPRQISNLKSEIPLWCVGTSTVLQRIAVSNVWKDESAIQDLLTKYNIWDGYFDLDQINYREEEMP